MASAVPFSRRSAFPSDIKDRIPHSEQAETIVLATIFKNNAALKTVSQIIKAEDFFTPNGFGLSWNGKIFLAMVILQQNESPVDTYTVIDHLSPDTVYAAHIQSLGDALNTWPGVNVEHYAKVIREKALQRKFLHKTYALQEQILNGQVDSAAQIATDLELFSKETITSEGNDKLIAVDWAEFLTMNLAPKDYIIMPLLATRQSAMIYAPTGAGKTYIMLYLAHSVAIGFPNIFVWDIPKHRRVVYVEGEMDGQDLQERANEITRAFEGIAPDPNMLRLIASDLPGQPFAPRINTATGRKRIEEHLCGNELLILDNLSALCPAADEDESGEWSNIQEWILSLRRKGVGVFLMHHPGKSGSQLGTSKKEFQLNCNIYLKVPQGKEIAEGLRVEVRIEKLRSRGTGFKAEWAQPFEISLRTEGDGDKTRAVFTHRPLRELLRQRALEMLEAGMRENDVAAETGLDRFAIYRIQKRRKAGEKFPTVE